VKTLNVNYVKLFKLVTCITNVTQNCITKLSYTQVKLCYKIKKIRFQLVNKLKESMLKPLKGYQVRAYPDKSVFENWNALADVLNTKGYYIKTSSLLENMDLENGADLIDLLK
jgi:hypothetical protein